VYWTGGCDELGFELDELEALEELLVEVALLELEKLELDEFELLEELLDDGGVKLEALLEDKEGLGPTSPHAARISTEAIRKDHFTDF
jgi:hypothetical protein